MTFCKRYDIVATGSGGPSQGMLVGYEACCIVADLVLDSHSRSRSFPRPSTSLKIQRLEEDRSHQHPFSTSGQHALRLVAYSGGGSRRRTGTTRPGVEGLLCPATSANAAESLCGFNPITPLLGPLSMRCTHWAVMSTSPGSSTWLGRCES